MIEPYKVHTSEPLPGWLSPVVISQVALGVRTHVAPGTAVAQRFTGKLEEIYNEVENAYRIEVFDRAKAQLTAQNRADHLLMAYSQLDVSGPKVLIHTTWHFSDKDTALLFKLSWQ